MSRPLSGSRALPWLLALSLSANLGAALLWRHTRGPGEFAESNKGREPAPGSPASAEAPAPAASDAEASGKSATFRAASSAADQARAIRDALRAAGAEEPLVRRLVELAVWDRHSKTNRKPLPWWQASGMGSELAPMPASTVKAVGAELAGLFDAGPTSVAQPTRLDFLPEKKRAEIERVFRDYAEMSGGIYAEMHAFQMPEDQRRLQLLKIERDKDLAALLTPEEYTEVTLLESPAGQRAQHLAQQLDLSEEEFRAVAQLRREADARMAAMSAPTPAEHNAEEARFQRELEELIGAERIREQNLRRSQDAKVLERARDRLGFPPETFDRVLAQRERVREAVSDIEASTATVAEKRAALGREAAAVKAEIARLLGQDGAEGYFMQNGMSWLRDLERGRGVRFTPGGWPESFEVE